MKVLHLSFTQRQGGAAIAAHRLHRALQEAGVDSQMLVQEAVDHDDCSIHPPQSGVSKVLAKARPHVEKVAATFIAGHTSQMFSMGIVPTCVDRRIAEIKPDIIHLHWVARGVASIEEIRAFSSCPIVWTLHDLWPITGGCHYPSKGCTRFTQRCGKCPQIGSTRATDVSRLNWHRKRRLWDSRPIAIVAPSHWVRRQVSKSSLANECAIEVIPNALDLSRFRPHRREDARDVLGLPLDRRLIAFGAISATTDSRKGFDLLNQSLKLLDRDDVEVVVFGNSDGQYVSQSADRVPVRFLGRVSDERLLPIVYSAADVMVVPSRTETFGQTASEALACGTPVAAFRTSGLQDIVDHRENGYLAERFDPADLVNGIHWILDELTRENGLVREARRKAERQFEFVKVANSHVKFYESVLASR